MKILVDKLPLKPADCPFSIYRNNAKGDSWMSCSKGTHVCEVSEKGCPYFADIRHLSSAERTI